MKDTLDDQKIHCLIGNVFFVLDRHTVFILILYPYSRGTCVGNNHYLQDRNYCIAQKYLRQ